LRIKLALGEFKTQFLEYFALRPSHQYAYLNRELISQSAVCGCFYCLAMFSSDEIEEWTDEPKNDDKTTYGLTALCPKCGIDSVLSDNMPGIKLDAAFLARMKKCFFLVDHGIVKGFLHLALTMVLSRREKR